MTSKKSNFNWEKLEKKGKLEGDLRKSLTLLKTDIINRAFNNKELFCVNKRNQISKQIKNIIEPELENLFSNFSIFNENEIKSDSLSTAYLNPDITVLPNFTDMILKSIFSLSVVIVLIIGFVMFIKKFVYNRSGSNISNGLIKVINTTYIAPKKSINLVKIMDRILVVGITENQMQTLAEFKEEEIPDSIIETRKRNGSIKQFSDYFNMFFDKVRKRNHKEERYEKDN